MSKEVKNKIFKIILSSILLVVAITVDNRLDLTVTAKFIIYVIPYLIVGLEILQHALQNAIHGEFFDEDFLMSLATISSFVLGILPGAEPKFIEDVLVMILFQLGEIFEELAEKKSENAITEIMKIRPDYACIEEMNKIVKVDPRNLNIGDVMVIRPGDKIPLDGIIIEGESTINTIALTGESLPKEVKKGDIINSGCINLSGTIKARVNKNFGESTASKIIDLVKNANEKKSKSEKFITKFSKIYTPTVIAIAVLLATIPSILIGNSIMWIERALIFLIISCPCALVISVPLTFLEGITYASSRGILIKGSSYIDKLANISTIIFDKTGTLTKGVFEISAIHSEKYDENKLLHLAAHVERNSTHPIANSIKKAYGEEDDECNVTEVEEFSGLGIRANVNGDIIYVGNSKLMEQIGIQWKECERIGTILHVAINDKYFGHIVISDIIKEESEYTIKKLKAKNIKTIMLSGDKKEICNEIVEKLNIDKYYAELLPADKVKKLEDIISKNNGKGNVAFIGDGINDCPVLAEADIGIAMGTIGSDSAIETADVVIMDDKISKLIEAMKISKRTISRARQNTIFAIAVKAVVLLLAAFGKTPMWLAFFADVGVTVIAILNSMRKFGNIDFLNN